MAEFVTILFILAFLATLLGLVIPQVFFWNKEPNSIKVLKQGGLATLCLFILMAIAAPKQEPQEIDNQVPPGVTDKIAEDSESPFPHAKPYKIIGTDDFSTPGRKRVGVYIVSSAETRDERAHTTMKAAVEYQEKTKADFVAAYLELSAIVKQDGNPLAVVDYAPDGKGISGDDDWKWKAEVSADKIEPEHLKVAELWKQNREKFKKSNGLLDENALKQYISKKLSIPVERVSFLFVHRESYKI